MCLNALCIWIWSIDYQHRSDQLRVYVLKQYPERYAQLTAKVVLLCYYLHHTVHHLLHDVEIGGMTSRSWSRVALHEHSPERYNSFRNACPVPMYTQRNGVFNLLARVNSGLFNTPDPGPKLYIAHGNAREPKYCTTPLHIDHSDAVNGLMFSCVTDDERSADITGN